MFSQTTTTAQRKDYPTLSTVLIVDIDLDELGEDDREILMNKPCCLKQVSMNAAIDFLNKPCGPKVDFLFVGVADPVDENMELIQHLRSLHCDLPIVIARR